MQDQVENIAHWNITAAYKGSCPQSDDRIKEGLIIVIFASPETLVVDPYWRTCLKKLNIKLIVIDEFHTIAIWGQDEGDRKEAFRKWFSNVGELRSLFPDATVVALSATCTVSIRKKVMKILQLAEDTTEINLSPNKSNIKLVSSKIKNEIEMGMTWRKDLMCNFLRNSDLNDLMKKESMKHSCCDLCAKSCNCDFCDMLPLEKLFLSEQYVEELEEQEDSAVSDSDTEDYNLSAYEYFEDLDMALL
ncbi:recQ [Mytilus coruscus]|uniref:RecQ n=1 Tax=Mytilus coruscus TaxID=42192 RepID=A0A6J8DI53_MYTCO|nr:recQ [Mytilus coruscus]